MMPLGLETLRLKLVRVVAAMESLVRTVKLYWPALIGVPEMLPPARVRPGGRPPEVRVWV